MPAKKVARKKPAPAKKLAKPVAKSPAKAKAKAKAKSGTSPLADRLAKVAIPADAWALARVRPGTGVAPHVDQLLALGFPHMISVVDEPLPSTDVKQALRSWDLSRVVPREMLPRLFAYQRTRGSVGAAAAFAAEPKPFELASVVEDELFASGWDRIWMLEAMFGSTAVAEAFVDACVKLPIEEWFEGPLGGGGALLSGLGMIIDRTPPATRERLRGELDALFVALDQKDEYSAGCKRLDVILHGREGVERNARIGGQGEYDATDYAWARDDPKWVESQVLAAIPKWKARERRWFDAQLCFVGGPKVVAALREVLASGVVMADHRDAVEQQLGLFT